MSRMPKFEEFDGVWRLSRQIDDRHGDTSGSLEGEAEFTAADGGYDYVESGRLSYAGHTPLNASRCYRWDRDGETGVKVKFSDGAAFHRFPLNRQMPDATHICSADMYYVTYDFAHWPEWYVTWRVVGPKKDYRMVTHYWRDVTE